MRLFCAFVLAALFWVLIAAVGGSNATAFIQVVPPPLGQDLLLDAKIVCGDFGNGYACQTESGAVRKSGKTRQVPRSGSDSSGSGGWFGGRLFGGDDDPDALPPPSEGAGTTPSEGGNATTLPGATATSCPANSELLGGHCIPYTQRCTTGVAPNAYPPQCQGAEEKQVCNFRPDGSKDCCCRTYAKF